MDDIHNLFKITIDQLHEGIQIIGYDWSYVYLNKAVISQSRVSEDLLLNRRMMDVFPGLEKTEMFQILRMVMQDRQPRQMENQFDFYGQESGWFDLYFEPHSMGVLVRSIDITQKKKLEERYRESQRLEVIGQYEGGITQEIDNKLGMIKKLSELALQELGDPKSLRSHLEKILSVVNEATALGQEASMEAAQQVIPVKAEIATLAGGCFWGMEELLRSRPGVLDVDVGYTGGKTDRASYEIVKTGATGHAESVQIKFDPSKTSYEEILLFFFKIHDPTTLNQQGNDRGSQYRSAIFYHDQQQLEIAERVKARVEKSGAWKKPVVTEIKAFDKWFVAEAYHQDYLQKNPNGYTCHMIRNLNF